MKPPRYYVRAEARGLWHAEKEEDPEYMLCGVFVPLELPGGASVQGKPGPRMCPDCFVVMEQRRAVEALRQG